MDRKWHQIKAVGKKTCAFYFVLSYKWYVPFTYISEDAPQSPKTTWMNMSSGEISWLCIASKCHIVLVKGGEQSEESARAEKKRTEQSRTQLSTAQHSAAQRSTAQRSTAQHSTAQHDAAQHSTARYNTAQRSTAQHITAQHSSEHSTALHSTLQHIEAQQRRGGNER